MRARKNPPSLTLDSLLAEMRPGRGYSIESLSLKFGAPANDARAEEVRTMVLGAVMLGKIHESKARRGFRVTYWIPQDGRHSVAMSRTLSPYWQSNLTGYTDYLLGHMDLCLASRGKAS